jgi:D-glycero-alpha-D-manno-heptose 1-phosphate guanylyltransferase
MEVIILAGGFGTRLQSVVRDVPKPMADIKGRPFLAYLLNYFAARGASKIVLSVGYKQETIIHYFGDRYQGLDITYVAEETPLGTGGAIRKALEKAEGDTVVAANGDSFLALNLASLLRTHENRKADVTLALKPMEHCDRYGTVLVDSDRAVGFLEKAPRSSGLINGGVYALDRKRVLHLLKDQKDPFSFETDFLQKKVEKINAFVYIATGYFIDIGVPSDYERAQRELDRFVLEGAQE